jgi:hypothetical protein
MNEPKPVSSRAKPRKVLLSLPRRRATDAPAASAYRALFAGEVEFLLRRLEVLDKAIEDIHNLIQDLMLHAKFVVGVEWIPHRTRPGLHPVFARRKGRLVTKPFVRPGCEPVQRRTWATELKSGYLERHQACMPGQEALVLPCLADALRLARTFMEERELLMGSLGAVRRLLAARRNASSAADVAMQVSDLERRSTAARSVLTSISLR